MPRGLLSIVAVLLVMPPPPASGQPAVTRRVSVPAGGGEINGGVSFAALSADGRSVAFQSVATNLVAGDTNGVQDIFIHDWFTGTTTRVSVATGGAEANAASYRPVISADGRFVAFWSSATNLVAGDTNSNIDVFVHDRQTGTTTRASVKTGGGQVNGGACYSPAISADGRYVTFDSGAGDIVPGDTNGDDDIFVHDRQTGTTSRVSVATGGGEANSWSWESAISGDGRFVGFVSEATNLVAGDTNGVRDVFVHDRQTGTTTRVSVATGGAEADRGSLGPVLSHDGRYVVFYTSATNLVPGDTNGLEDVFVRDLQSATTTRVSVATGGVQASLSGGRAAISADGQYVAFVSGSNLVPDDTNGSTDVFVHHLPTVTTTRVSLANGGGESNGGSAIETYALSASGRFVLFSSLATNLVPGDTNLLRDLFVRDRGSWRADFDADRMSDATVFRPSSGTWFQLRSGGASGYGVAWGMTGDVPVPGDYDGDGTAEAAVFRPASGTWFVLQSTTGTGVSVPWGVATDVPVPADYDGDGKTDVAVWRPSTGVWYVIRSSTNTAVGIIWGTTGDVPVPGDFDGDGKADPTVFRPSAGTWYELRSTTGAGYGVVWGQNGDVPLAGDYDGDGKADPTVFRASTGTWYELRSTTGTGFGVIWGTVNDVPIVGDYDGDGRADPTVFRPSTSTWYQLRSTTGGGYGVIWGAAGDLPQ